MDYIFDCFFEEVLKTLDRSGLHSRQNRKNLIDQLNAVISGCCSGLHQQNFSLLFIVEIYAYQCYTLFLIKTEGPKYSRIASCW